VPFARKNRLWLLARAAAPVNAPGAAGCSRRLPTLERAGGGGDGAGQQGGTLGPRAGEASVERDRGVPARQGGSGKAPTMGKGRGAHHFERTPTTRQAAPWEWRHDPLLQPGPSWRTAAAPSVWGWNGKSSRNSAEGSY